MITSWLSWKSLGLGRQTKLAAPDLTLPELEALKRVVEKDGGGEAAAAIRFLERVTFKLCVARDSIAELRTIERIFGTFVNGESSARYSVEKWLDIFLYEAKGSFDAFLQAINVLRNLKIDPKKLYLWEVRTKLPKKDSIREVLERLSAESWFTDLTEYRHHSTHRSAIGFNVALNVSEPGAIPQVRLYRDPITRKEASQQTVLEFCQSSYEKMQELIEELSRLAYSKFVAARTEPGREGLMKGEECS